MIDNLGTKTVEIQIDGMHCESCAGSVRGALEAVEGVEYVDVSVGKARVNFIPQIISRDLIEKAIDETGYTVRKNTKRKGFFGRYIDRMIESNAKNFGNQRLDCCTLPKDKTVRRSTQKH
ncbi:MAG: heavy-metal-associated domain-containing protein [Spirochaetales bacterium]|jgi:copper chaperone CopZ|nr:heavy-metal-associated domain-containing protein [Spirochaetales bacterium]